MLTVSSHHKVYVCTGLTDMRKGIDGLSGLASDLASDGYRTGAMFVFRGKRSDRIKILWWDGQGFCLVSKRLDSGKFTWPKGSERGSVGITGAQLSMLMEGIDWRNPRWSNAPKYAG